MNENLSPVQIGHRIKIKLNELGLRQKILLRKLGYQKMQLAIILMEIGFLIQLLYINFQKN